MKIPAYPLCITLFTLIVTGCSTMGNSPLSTDHGITPPEQSRTMAVSMAIATNAEVRSVAVSAEVVVSGAEFAPMTAPLVIDVDLIQGTITHVPIGVARRFEISVRDADSIVRYFGSIVTDINFGRNQICIALHKVTNGEVVLMGVIQDTPADETWPWYPVSPLSTASFQPLARA